MTAKVSPPFHRLAIAAGLALSAASAWAAEAEQVTLPSLDGTQLTGRLFRPAGQGPFAAVVMLHGCAGMVNKNGGLTARETDWAKRFVGMGLVVLLPDSFTARGVKSICRVADRPVRPYRERPQDAYGALRWLQAQSYVKPDRIALAGWSNGAMTALWTLKDDAKARPKDLAHDFVAGVAFYPGCIDLGKTTYKAKAPMLLQVGLEDNWTMPKPCVALVEAANGRGGAKMEIDAYENAVHDFDHPNLAMKTTTTRNNAAGSGAREVRIGTNPEARQKAIQRVTAYLRGALALE